MTRSLLQQLRGAASTADVDSRRRPVGVVDIGSNSVRLVIYEAAERAPTQLFNEKVLCGLGGSSDDEGNLGGHAVTMALEAMARFRAVADLQRVKELRALATAAVRDASNGAEFIAEAETVLGRPIEVLSGEREAELAAQGIFMGFADPDGIAGDLGGGSLELIRIRDETLADAVSIPMGVLRLKQQSDGKRSAAADIAKGALGEIAWIKSAAPERFYAVGGSWRALGKLHMAERNYPLRVMHHYTVPYDDALDFCQNIRRSRRIAQHPGINRIARQRRDDLPFGAIALEQTLRMIKPREVVFSSFGIREGLLFDLLTPEERGRDPLISFCERYAAVRARDPVFGREVFEWLAPVYAAVIPDDDPAHARLRLAACLLSDIGWRAHPDYRGEQSLNVIAHAALTGIDHPGRLFLALTNFFRYAGSGESSGEKLPDDLIRVANEALIFRARMLAAAIRAAHQVSCGVSGIVKRLPLSVSDGVLTLAIPADLKQLDGAKVRQRFESFADLFNCRLDVDIRS